MKPNLDLFEEITCSKSAQNYALQCIIAFLTMLNYFCTLNYLYLFKSVWSTKLVS